MRYFNEGAGSRQLRVQRREHADAFNYTPEEAEFCESQSHSKSHSQSKQQSRSSVTATHTKPPTPRK